MIESWDQPGIGPILEGRRIYQINRQADAEKSASPFAKREDGEQKNAADYDTNDRSNGDGNEKTFKEREHTKKTLECFKVYLLSSVICLTVKIDSSSVNLFLYPPCENLTICP